jgi:hypothetical protein
MVFSWSVLMIPSERNILTRFGMAGMILFAQQDHRERDQRMKSGSALVKII